MNLSWSLLETGADGRWVPGIGDPTLMGWVTVAAYALAAWLAWAASRTFKLGANDLHAAQPSDALGRRQLAGFWTFACISLVCLGINKQLDLQSLFTQTMRDLARTQGWYAERRGFQIAFIAFIAIVGFAGVGALAYALRRVLRQVWMALLGLGWVVSFVVIRAASFHHVDVFLRGDRVRWNWVLELSGIALIGWNGYLAARPARARFGGSTI